MLSIDFHTHSIVSGHAMNSIEELLRQADANGMEGLAITDHCPGIDNTLWLIRNRLDSAGWESRIRGPDISHFLVFLSRYQQPSDIKTRLFKGIECNILDSGDRGTDVPLFIADKFDVVIASVHPLESLFTVTSREQVTERIILAMDDPIDIIGHPFQKSCSPILEPLVQAAVDKGITLELNNSSLFHKKSEVEDILSMLRLAREKGCTVSISSDAHMSNELGLDREIRAVLQDSRFPEELIVNRSLSSATEFIQERQRRRKEKKERLSPPGDGQRPSLEPENNAV